jgi:hypothetical protein
MNEELTKKLEDLRGGISVCEEMLKKMIEADDGAIYPLDLYAIGTLHRSQALIDGFCDLVSSKNLIGATPLIRLQLDNALRFYAAFIVDDPHQFAGEVLKGESVRNLKDKENKKMTDNYLVNKLSVEHPFITPLYEQTCGFVHFSNTHIYYSMQDIKDDGTFSFPMLVKDIEVKDEIFIQAIDAFKSSTNVLLKYIESWIFTKDNPEMVEE